MKIIFIITFYVLQSFASPLPISISSLSQTTAEHQIILSDHHNTLSASDVFKAKEGESLPSSISQWNGPHFWTKFSITNDTNHSQTLVLRNPRAGMDYIDVYIFTINGNLHKTHMLGAMRGVNQRELSAPKSAFLLTIQPNESFVIITKHKNLGALTLYWEILSLQDFQKSNTIESIAIGIFCGIFITLIVYSLTMFNALREKLFLFYALHAIVAMIDQSALDGLVYYADLGIDLFTLRLSTWFLAPILTIFLILFTITFFEINKKNKHLVYYLYTLCLIQFLFFLIFLYGYIDKSVVHMTPLFIVMLIFAAANIFIISLFETYKKSPGAHWFLIGEGAYLLSLVYILLAVSSVNQGNVDLLKYLYLAGPLGLTIEIIFMFLAISAMVNKIKQENIKQEKILAVESKFAAIGKKLGSVTHQWKNPLSVLASQFMLLEANSKYNPKDFVEHFKNEATHINATILYMKESIDELYDYYSSDVNMTLFNVKQQIEMALKISNDRLILNNVNVEIICEPSHEIYNSKNAFINVLLVLIDNSIDQVIEHQTKNPCIKIVVKNTAQDKFEIIFSDNAGGVDPKWISKIFDISFTTKRDNGSGIGLALAKDLVEIRMHGHISVKNIDYGASFTLLLPHLPSDT